MSGDHDHQAPPPRGILCPKCACPRVPVLRTQRIPDAIRRRHECFHCGARFWSRAKIEAEEPPQAPKVGDRTIDTEDLPF